MGPRVLSLAKDSHKYIFRYTPGCEQQVIDEIMRLADDPDTSLDWLDAATLGFQVAQQAAGGYQYARTIDRNGDRTHIDDTTEGTCTNTQ